MECHAVAPASNPGPRERRQLLPAPDRTTPALLPSQEVLGMLNRFSRRFAYCTCTAALAFALLAITPLAAQMTPDQAADMLLTSARRAYNERNFPFAAARFREFLAKFGNHKDAAA